MLKVAFRVDASLQIGSGHVMRCLTLADALRDRGGECHFICRTHPGHLADMILDRQFSLHSLSPGAPGFTPRGADTHELPAHAAWLGCTWEDDACETASILETLQPDWLVTDHYAIDAHWHAALAPYCRLLLAIDDLADRTHQCDVLLDQTFARESAAYFPLVPRTCRVLCGSEYALLRPQFADLRGESLQRRRTGSGLRRLLVTMGGVDKDNITGQVLEALRGGTLPTDCEITVVMGATAPWLANVRAVADTLPWRTRVLVDIQDMASVMCSADLCIGAAGSTAWERCALGLPTLMAVTAMNQQDIARSLHGHGAARCLGPSDSDDFPCRVQAAIEEFAAYPQALRAMSEAACVVTDGCGAGKVCDILLEAITS